MIHHFPPILYSPVLKLYQDTLLIVYPTYQSFIKRLPISLTHTGADMVLSRLHKQLYTLVSYVVGVRNLKAD